VDSIVDNFGLAGKGFAVPHGMPTGVVWYPQTQTLQPFILDPAHAGLVPPTPDRQKP
jgi:hypothetical protein